LVFWKVDLQPVGCTRQVSSFTSRSVSYPHW